MQINTYKTRKIQPGDDLYTILDSYLPQLEENSIVVITSKIISLCQKNVYKNDGTIDKKDLIRQEADYFLEDERLNKYGIVILTIKNSILIANAGVDESNADGYFVLWPRQLFQTIKDMWYYLRKKHSITNLGITVTDSRLIPLSWGTRGVGLSWCGFRPLNSYIGKPDIFGRPLRMTQASILDGIASAAVVVMGEGAEQTPLAVVRDIPFVQFQQHPPTEEEINNLRIDLEDDMFSPLLTSVTWRKGG